MGGSGGPKVGGAGGELRTGGMAGLKIGGGGGPKMGEVCAGKGCCIGTCDAKCDMEGTNNAVAGPEWSQLPGGTVVMAGDALRDSVEGPSLDFVICAPLNVRMEELAADLAIFFFCFSSAALCF
jgi:hypothetical protein